VLLLFNVMRPIGLRVSGNSIGSVVNDPRYVGNFTIALGSMATNVS
jgi:hypothetical protein